MKTWTVAHGSRWLEGRSAMFLGGIIALWILGGTALYAFGRQWWAAWLFSSRKRAPGEMAIRFTEVQIDPSTFERFIVLMVLLVPPIIFYRLWRDRNQRR